MKIFKSFASFFCAFFITTLISQYSGIRFDDANEVLLHHEYSFYENTGGASNELIFN